MTVPTAAAPADQPLRPAGDPASLRALALIGAGVGVAAFGGATWSPVRPEIGRWYRSLDKPGYTPPDPVFGAAWGVLYPLVALSAWRVLRSSAGPERDRAARLWWLQLALNAAWSPIFFGRRALVPAFVDAVALAAAAAAYADAARRVDRRAAQMVAPYVLWTAFAAVLAGSIARRNRAR